MIDAQLVRKVEVAGVAALALVGSLLLRRWILGRLARHAVEQPHSVAGVVREGLATPSLLWCLAVSLDVLLNLSELGERATKIANNAVVSFLILSFTMVASSVSIRAIQRYGERQNMPFAVAGLSRTLTRTLVFSIGLLILLRFLGISITPLITALGVGGLAVALALQDTLANFFAGVHILIERPIAVGDYIRLSAEEEGTVRDIGWRTTRLLTSANNIVVIPNKTITSGNLLNYTMPDPAAAVFVPLMLGLEADVEKAEKIAIECALATEGVVAVPPPVFLADPGMQPTHLQYRVAFQVHQFLGSGLIRTAVLKKILAQFRAEKIEMPETGLIMQKRS
ncbi:MAG: mechanosensitive ion channel [Acidobacteria bacterium]|nr:mechanosensitive ion channel [Acidobacteriota bacterium]